MNIVFMGTPDFAVDCLRALVENGHRVSAVFSQPDKPQGRKMVLTPPEVKVCAQELELEVFQPATLKDGEAEKIIKSLSPDLIAVVAYGKIIPQTILDIPRYGCVNVHGSLLPKLRGAAPIQRSILNGDKETGVTTMLLDAGLDTGDILLVDKTEIGENETSGELFDRLKVMGAQLLIKTINGLEEGTITPKKQNNSESTYAAMLDKTMSAVDWTQSAFTVHNQIRGLEPWPVATTLINSKPVKLYGSRLGGRSGKTPGEVVETGKTLAVCCGDGNDVIITALQAQGKTKLSSADFLRGFRLEVGTVLGQ